MRAAWFVLVSWSATAAADPCAPLATEARRAEHWNLAWRLILTSATVGQAALAITPSLDRDTRRAAAVGAAESFIGAAGVWILPLRIDATGCDLEHAAEVEHGAFWMLHAGNLVVNAGGALALGEMTDWSRAGLSFAVGYSVGLVQIYTMPRMPLHVAPAPVAGGWGIGLVTTF